ncbi:hypothetical protein Y032_0082g1523 [Ancylostoma ceylanicum]|uniref:Uncharacterized protein n=1 Tax=Ancylostoma ceylanicum TaxID=53326 RepID=A0A016TQL2_9BILA|nr:hypothetical protein Y032_0082g1523 [Ancylostoma ceylanicum]
MCLVVFVRNVQNVRTKGTDYFLSFLKLNPSKVFSGLYAVSCVRMSLPDCHLPLAQSVRIHEASLATPIFRRDPNATPPLCLGMVKCARKS